MPWFSLVCKSFAKQEWGTSYHKEHCIAYWFVIPLQELQDSVISLQDREKIYIYLYDRRDAADRHLWMMNPVHFIHSQIPLKGKTISRVPPAQPSPALQLSFIPCWTCCHAAPTINPFVLLKAIWLPQRTVGWLPSISAKSTNTPLVPIPSWWDFRKWWTFPSTKEKTFWRKGLSIAEEPRRTYINELLHRVLSDRAKWQSGLHLERCSGT